MPPTAPPPQTAAAAAANGGSSDQPGNAAAAANTGDRPHTISAVYEKGGARQRPQIGANTFQPPGLRGAKNSQVWGKEIVCYPATFDFRTIFFSQDDTASLHSVHPPPQPPPRPPVPQRCTSLDSSTSSLTSAAASSSSSSANRPPSLPSGKKPFFGSLKKQQQQQVLQQQQQQQQLRQQQMPNFNAGKEDMGMFYLFTHFLGNCYKVTFSQLSPNLCT